MSHTFSVTVNDASKTRIVRTAADGNEEELIEAPGWVEEKKPAAPGAPAPAAPAAPAAQPKEATNAN